MPYLTATRGKGGKVYSGPQYSSGEVGSISGSVVVIRFDEPVKSTNFKNGVTIKVNGSGATIDSATIQTDKHYAYCVLHTATVWGDIVTWEYAAASGDISSLSNVVLQNVSAKTVTNNNASLIGFYVDATAGNDSNTGRTTGDPWKTLAKVNAATMHPGEYILLKCGEVWYETLTVPAAGTTGKPITITSYGTGAKPIISGASAAAPTTPIRSSCIYEINGYGYITVDGIEVAYALDYGITHNRWNANATEYTTPNWIVQNCVFTKCVCRLFGPNTIVQDNVFVGPQPATADEGGLLIRGAVATNCQILRNTISGYYSRGIWLLIGVTAPTVNDNIVHDITWTYGTTTLEGYGINFDGFGRLILGSSTCMRNTVYNCSSNGIEFENCSQGSTVYRNLIHDCGGHGIVYMNYAAQGSRYTDQRGNNVGALITYNIIYRCNHGIQHTDCGGTDIWNNVIWEGVGTAPKGIAMNTTYCTDVDIRNTIIGNGWSYAISVPNAVWTDQISYLDYSALQSACLERRSSTNYTLAQLQGLSYCLNSFSTTPGFTDSTNHDFTLAVGSPCINAGINVGQTKDFANVDVGNPPEIGAYEYV
jgi:hypothetical protein